MSARISLPLTLSLGLAGLCSASCDDSLKQVSLVEETRVVGARVESEGDTNQATPLPGQHASLRLFVVAPNGEANFSYALSLCAVAPSNFGFPPCADAPFAAAQRLAASTADARLDFVVPEDTDLRATPHVLARGLICADSALYLAADGSQTCASGSAKELGFEFPLGGADEANRNPRFGDEAFELDGEPWLASLEASCDAVSVRQVSAKSAHAIRVTFTDDDFEALSRPTAIDPGRETLLVSPFSTAGELDHGFVSLSADTPPEQRRVNWTAPALADASSILVRFYFVVRDARSGEDFTSRALCVVP